MLEVEGLVVGDAPLSDVLLLWPFSGTGGGTLKNWVEIGSCKFDLDASSCEYGGGAPKNSLARDARVEPEGVAAADLVLLTSTALADASFPDARNV